MNKVLLFLISTYQLSRPFRPATCRFYPSCSSYAYGCLEKHGTFQGGLLTMWRLLRCHPFCDGGVEEVPAEFSFNLFRSFVSKRV